MTATGHPFFSLDGVCALVTGASGGIGKAVVAALASVGARVACADIVPPQDVPADGLALVSDFTTEESAEEAVAATVEQLGGLHVLVNCVGALIPNRPAEDVPLDDVERAFAVNATGVFIVCQRVARQMISVRSGGTITNITSLAELTALPNQAAYTASKGALAALTRALALDWAQYGIRVNSIAPGPVETRMTERFYADRRVKEKLIGRIPLGRLGQPDDIAGAALFLSCAASGFVTGHTLVVDGGWRAGEPNLLLQ